MPHGTLPLSSFLPCFVYVWNFTANGDISNSIAGPRVCDVSTVDVVFCFSLFHGGHILTTRLMTNSAKVSIEL